MKYRHVIIDNQPISQMMQINNFRREIIQKGNQVSYFEPGFDSFSLEGTYIVDYLPSVVFANFAKLQSYYNFIKLGRTHIGDISCQVIRVIPKDNSRFSYIFLIDQKSKLPLPIDLLDSKNEILEQFRVVSVAFNSQALLKSMHVIASLNMPPLLLIPKSITKRFNWQINQLPLGFEEIFRSCKEIATNESLETMLFSDRLFSFSINVTKAGTHQLSEKPFRKGGLTIYTVIKGQYEVTVIAKRLNFDDIIYMSYSIYFRRKVIFTMEEEGLSIRETTKQFRIVS
ncbi:MucB/RseB C-terminal domain-containing protein, partial [Arsenophonus endosymbiont of Bemisia tabaci]|uniref:MucB/RseB C-terminal domain-containing protein n=1 Tax=Arsenophonus endosymbiont of Bemisia tabaci TaxID=536059 RepID=UPI001EE2DDDE